MEIIEDTPRELWTKPRNCSTKLLGPTHDPEATGDIRDVHRLYKKIQNLAFDVQRLATRLDEIGSTVAVPSNPVTPRVSSPKEAESSGGEVDEAVLDGLYEQARARVRVRRSKARKSGGSKGNAKRSKAA